MDWMDAPIKSILEKKRFTSDEIEFLYTVEKTLDNAIIWLLNKSRTKYSTKTGFCIDRVLMGYLIGRYNIGNEISFRLQTRYHQLIRMFHHQFRQKHENPNGEIIEGDHKHKEREDFAYKVNNIDISGINKALVSFLVECNIKFDEEVEVIPITLSFSFKTTLEYFGGKK